MRKKSVQNYFNIFQFLAVVLFSSCAVKVETNTPAPSASNGNTSAPSTSATAPSQLSYSDSSTGNTVTEKIYITNHSTTATTLTPTFSGSNGTFSVLPALPTGLTLHTSTGVISGTPTAQTAAANYTITLTNAAGSTTSVLNLRIADGYVVTSTGDATDTTDDGICDADGGAAGDCTLRAAIAEIENAAPVTGNVIFIPANTTISIGANNTLTMTTSSINREIIGEDQSTVIIDGANTYRIMNFTGSDNSTISLSKMTLQNAYHATGGGAIIASGLDGTTLNIDQVTFSGNNVTGDGGAIYLRANITNSTGNFTQCTFINNTSTNFGGAIYTYDAQTFLNISKTYFENNQSNYGAAIYNVSSTNVYENTTFYNNSAANAGGAIYSNDSATTIRNSTLANNTSGFASVYSGGIHIGNGSPLYYVKNTVLSGNTGNSGQCYYGASSLISQGGNLLTTVDGHCGFNCTAAGAPDADCEGADLTIADPLLAVPANNGGLSKTMAPGNNVLINSGINSGCPSTDQRGLPRAATVTDACDVGAYEDQ